MKLFRDYYLDAVANFSNNEAYRDPSSGVSFSFAEFDDYVRKTMTKLSAAGLKRGDTVVITMPRSVHYIATMCACVLSGICYVPQADSHPETRIRLIADDAEAKAILDAAFWDGIDTMSLTRDLPEIAPEELAVMIYTSGSTGKPKGVMHNAAGLARSIERYQKFTDFQPDDIYGSNAPFYFVVHIQDAFSAFLHGVTTVLIPDDLRGDPKGLSAFLEREGISLTYIAPKVLRYFKKQGTSLRRVMTGSERVANLCPTDFQLVNGYGMSETASGTLMFLVDKNYDNTPIGRAIGDDKFYCLDEDGNETDEGELCVAGHIAVGYKNLPELTAETFVQNPFADEDGFPTLLHTGDLVRKLPSGDFLYINRKDWMIKVNGQRVEPGEIEAAIRDLDGILDAAVKDFTRADGQTFIAAYYVLRDEARGGNGGAADVGVSGAATVYTEDELKELLAKKLPSYMIPAYFIQLDALPTNANGKLDRKALEPPMLSDYTTEYVAPENEVQKTICEAFAEILGVERVGITDDFFSLGGDSIKVLVLSNALEEYGVTKTDIFAAPTPQALAEKVAGKEDGAPSLADFVNGRGAELGGATFPLTESQLSIYLDSSDSDRQTIYNNVVGLFLPNEICESDTEERLLGATKTAIGLYPILRCHVDEVDGVPSLVLPNDEAENSQNEKKTETVGNANPSFEIPIIETEETDREKIAADFIRPFDLKTDALIRAELNRTPEGLFLLIDVHHIVSDGTSISLLIENISRAFNGDDLRNEKVTNLTLAQFEHEKLAEVKEADNAFYREMLDSLDGDTELYPDDAPELKEFAGKLGVYETLISETNEEILTRIRETAKRTGATESTIFMSAFAYLLGLLSGQKKVLHFAGENGRQDALLSDTFGMMVHNIPVVVDIDETTAAADYLKNSQSRFYDFVGHDRAAFSALLGEYHIRPEYSFVYQGDMLSGAFLGGKNIPLEFYKGDDCMDNLTLHVLKQKGGDFMLRFEYGAYLYTKDTVRRMANLLVRIISGLCGDKKLCEIDLAGAEDIAEQDTQNATEADYEIADIVTLFKKQVRLHPNNNAVFYKGEMLSYAMVDRISDNIASFLRSKGIGSGSVVSILISRSTYMVTASLGVLKTGAAYQPLDPSYPSERLTFMMADANAAYLIADEDLLSKVPEYRGDVMLTSDIPALPAAGALSDKTPSPEDLFILLYTSGSTGTPKGVQLLHKNLANFCGWYREFYGLDETSRVAAYASYGFDADMMDLYPALTTGACVFIIEEEIRLDLLALEAYFNENAITHSFMTTQVGRQFYTMAESKTLKFLSTGGEKLVPLAPVDGAAPFYNVYGPTECTILTTQKCVDRLYDRVPIGRPIGNYKVYVVDEYLRRLPSLVPGELLIAGAGVAKGYLNRDDLTEKAFIQNPFTDAAGYARAYRSGDVVRLLANGEVDFIGRRDGQVKVRGFRIELTEVEGIIREFDGIKDATVQAFEDESSGEKFIAAYIVADETIDIDALNAFIRAEKPPYMVPSVTMQLDAIPLNQNQKVNKKALPKPERQNVEIVPPENDVQKQIFDCLADVVGHKDFGITTDIYEAGLSSIGSIKLNAMLSKTFDLVFTTRDLKECDTILKLEAFVNARKNPAQGEEIHEADFSVRTDYPLSKTQEGVYVECVANPNTCTYNIPILLEIDRTLDLDKLKSAIVAAVNAHPFIKTRLFLNDDGEPRMRRMDADFSFDETAVDVREVSSLDDCRSELIKPFNLIGGRLYRISIIEATEKRYLFLEMHHLISDGTSMGIFLQDVSETYAGAAVETETYSGYEVVLNEEHIRTAEHIEETKRYYETLLDEAETQSLPVGDLRDGTARAVEPEKTADGADEDAANGFYEIDSDKVPVKAVRDFCEKNRLSLNAYFSAAFGFLLNEYLGTEKVVFAGIYNGRSDSRLFRTVAMLVKTIPIVSNPKAGETVAEHVAAMGRQLNDTMARDLYSFAEISRQFGVNADVMFAYQGDEFAFDTLCGKPAALLPVDLGEIKAPINVMLYLVGEKIRYSFEYDKARFSEAYIRAMAAAFEAAVSEMLVKKRMAEISLLTDETRTMLRDFNDTGVIVDSALAPERFTRAAKQYADQIAVLAKSGTVEVTYAELNRRVNKIANTLKANGIGRGDRVALYAERDENVYATRQGIMKAGAAFVSLEPDYPDERISFIIEDAGITTLITTGELFAARRGLFENNEKLSILLLEDIFASEISEADPDTSKIKETDAAYCIYTSGSTGTPKGVEILHKNLRNLLDYNDKNTLAHAYVDNSRTFLALAAITFDVSIIEEMMPLCHGKTVAIATDDEIHNPLLLLQMMKLTGVDMMKCTPSYMLSILDVQDAAPVFTQLRAVILGAEPFPEGMYGKMRDAGFDGIIFNSYGPTETCVSVSIGKLDGTYITIGSPSANTKFYIRDRFGNILPPYLRGELVIAGDCVGNGYVNLPDKTRAAFVTISNEGLAGNAPDLDGRNRRALPAYKSGDIAYFNANGEIMHCGRNDSQVKIRGLRVELDGIENTMNAYPSIERSVVLVLGEGDGQYLCGYYVSKHPVDEDDLSAFMRKTLTAYMVPGVFVHLEKLPLTVNGKVNKKALPKPQAKAKAKEGRAASTDLQKEIAAMFAKALGTDGVGIDENFFEIGGTSMLASKVAMSAMVKNLPIAYQDIFANPTVAELEAHVLKARGAADGNGNAAANGASGKANSESEKRARDDASAATGIVKKQGQLDNTIDAILAKNSLENIDGITMETQEDLGEVLLTGATGFLGIHVLQYLMEKTESTITCLIRKGQSETAEKRLKTLLTYYFDKPYLNEFESGRVRAVDGDITDKEIVLSMAESAGNVKTVINCAACVKHFANDDILERVNVTGVKNLIALCEKIDARLIQISTVSVAGEDVDHTLPPHTVMDETMLYFGQDLSNQYVRSKFEAEQAVLTELASGSLDAKIIRVGNLMSRASDGEFQANAVTSGFMRNLRGYATIGAFAVSEMARPVEFSPIEFVAEAVCLLAKTPKDYTVFHAVNGHWIEMGDLVAAMNDAGLSVAVVSGREFENRLKEAMMDENKNMLVSGLISYLSSDAETTRSYVPEDHTFTKNALYRLGFRWSLTDEKYLTNAIESLKTLGFFDGEL